MSTVAGGIAGYFGGAGATYGADFASAASSLTKAKLASSNVITKIASGGYATTKGMNIAISRTGNALVRAATNYSLIVNGMFDSLFRSLVASSFVGTSCSIIRGVFDFTW